MRRVGTGGWVSGEIVNRNRCFRHWTFLSICIFISWVVHPQGFSDQNIAFFAVVFEQYWRSISCCKMKPTTCLVFSSCKPPQWHSQVDSGSKRKRELITSRPTMHTVGRTSQPLILIPGSLDSTTHIINCNGKKTNFFKISCGQLGWLHLHELHCWMRHLII